MLRIIDDVVESAKLGTLREHLHANLEVKEEWSQKHGDKISGLANKIDQLICFLVVGVNSSGAVVGESEKWAIQTEEVLSQHVNSYLDPVQGCKEIACRQVDSSWIVVLVIRNPGEVTYWNEKAFCASGTTVHEMSPEEIMKLRIQLPGLIDFSNQTHKSAYNIPLVKHFAERVISRGHFLEYTGKPGQDDKVLQSLKVPRRL